MTQWGSGMYPHHRQILIDSGITAEQAHARGYVSIDSNNRSLLATRGLVKAVQKAAGCCSRSWALTVNPSAGSSDPITHES
jgi:hypothetical protein